MTSTLPRLTQAELDVMKVLWRADKLSAREIHEQVAKQLDWAYSTTRTTIERMVRKDLLEKTNFHGIHLYEARISRAAGLAGLVQQFASRVLEMSHGPVVSLFAESGSLDETEIAELRALLDEAGDNEAGDDEAGDDKAGGNEAGDDETADAAGSQGGAR